jgi:uncharacterized protein YlxP (DUF503 family)
MVTVSVLLTLRLAGVRSLKQKRAIVRSLVERLRTRQRVSAAEVGLQDDLRRAEVGFATVSGDFATARRHVEETRRFVDQELIGRAEVIDVQVDEVTLEPGL